MSDKNSPAEAVADAVLERLAVADETCRVGAQIMKLMRQFIKLQKTDLERMKEELQALPLH